MTNLTVTAAPKIAVRNEAPPPPPPNDLAAFQANTQLLCTVVNVGNGAGAPPPPPPPPEGDAPPPPPPADVAGADLAINLGQQNNIQLQCVAVNNDDDNLNNDQQCVDAVQLAIQALQQVAQVLQQIQDANVNQQALAAFEQCDAGMQAVLQAENAGQQASQDSLGQIQAGFQILQQLFGGGNK